MKKHYCTGCKHLKISNMTIICGSGERSKYCTQRNENIFSSTVVICAMKDAMREGAKDGT